MQNKGRPGIWQGDFPSIILPKIWHLLAIHVWVIMKTKTRTNSSHTSGGTSDLHQRAQGTVRPTRLNVFVLMAFKREKQAKLFSGWAAGGAVDTRNDSSAGGK